VRGEREQQQLPLTPNTRHLTPEVGFTLVELVFVMVILAVLLSFASPQLSKTAQRLRVEQAAFEMTQLMRYARNRAVTQEREMVWSWDNDARRAHVEAAAGSGAQEDEASKAFEKRFLESARVAEGITLNLMRDGSLVDDVSFFPDGTSSLPFTIIEVSRGVNVYHVRVDGESGQATITSGAAAN
jgi:prepilin-type N-terminal cleavage/methylation domain-containing protein